MFFIAFLAQIRLGITVFELRISSSQGRFQILSSFSVDESAKTLLLKLEILKLCHLWSFMACLEREKITYRFIIFFLALLISNIRRRLPMLRRY
jgi:hypothetical protein